MDEILLIDKPAGMTSFGVVARLRRVLSKQEGKKVKVGHTGTLDPFPSDSPSSFCTIRMFSAPVRWP